MHANKLPTLALVAALVLLVLGEARAAARWAELIGEPSADYICESIEQTPDGGYVLVGYKAADAVWAPRVGRRGVIIHAQYGGGPLGD